MNPDDKEYIHCPKCKGFFITLRPHEIIHGKMKYWITCLDKKCGYEGEQK